jgi:hypothetical protein
VNYEQLVAERMAKYNTTREVVERAEKAFFTAPQDSDPCEKALADSALAYATGARTLEDYLLYFSRLDGTP